MTEFQVAHEDSFCNIVSCIPVGEWGNSFCCMDQGNVSCCGDTFFNPIGDPISFPRDSTHNKNNISNVASTLPSHDAESTSSSTAQLDPSAAKSTSSPPKPSSDHSVAIGVGVGVPLGLLAISALAFLLFRERKLRRNAENNAEAVAQRSQQFPIWAQSSKPYAQRTLQELEVNHSMGAPAELGTKQIHEIGK